MKNNLNKIEQKMPKNIDSVYRNVLLTLSKGLKKYFKYITFLNSS